MQQEYHDRGVSLVRVAGQGFGVGLLQTQQSPQGAMAAWADRMADGIRDRLVMYEKRLIEVDVKAEHSQAEFSQKEGDRVAARLKRKLTIRLTARIKSTNEVFRFEDSIFMSPFSLD